MVTLKIAAVIGMLLLAAMLVQGLVFAPAATVTATATAEQPQHPPVIDLGQMGRAFRAG